ncbi:MAG TPA: NINE protein [Pyrinomonadaceae bacterium]|jgi:TM2 domain-containing membrane protein YozV|nr:NINE protein [Pyrinomonadaceae bacterium]
MGNTLNSNEKRLTLLLLCWLFGLLGVHRFYTGKYLTAGLQLFAWVLAGVLSLSRSEIIPTIPIGLLFLWWIIDVMLIIMGKFTDKEGRLIQDWV